MGHLLKASSISITFTPSQKDERSAIDPVDDLVPLCPNCHAVAYMGGIGPFAVEGIGKDVGGLMRFEWMILPFKANFFLS